MLQFLHFFVAKNLKKGELEMLSNFVTEFEMKLKRCYRILKDTKFKDFEEIIFVFFFLKVTKFTSN